MGTVYNGGFKCDPDQNYSINERILIPPWNEQIEMNNQSKFILSFLLVMAPAMLSAAPARTQFTDGSTGLLQMPTAEVSASYYEINCHFI